MSDRLCDVATTAQWSLKATAKTGAQLIQPLLLMALRQDQVSPSAQEDAPQLPGSPTPSPSSAGAARADPAASGSPVDDSARPIKPRPKRKGTNRPLTARDVAHKTCFICMGSQDDEDGADKDSEFVHACSCSLMAHESCLLTWIAEAQQRSTSPLPASQRPVKCPGCGTPYRIAQSNSPLLNLMDVLEKQFNKVAIYSALGVAGAGITAASSVYGVLATRAFVGPALSRRLFDGQWPVSHYFNLPVIAPLLLLNRLNWGPLLISLGPVFVPNHFNLLDETTLPPGPLLTLTLLTLSKWAYGSIRKRIWRLILSAVPSAALIQGPNRPLITIHAAQAPAAPPAVPQAAGAQPGQPGQGNVEVINGQAGGEMRLERREEAHIGLSLSGLARLALGALLWPFMSSVAGQGLLRLVAPAHPTLLSSRPAGFLRKFLGLGDPAVLRLALGWPEPAKAVPLIDQSWTSWVASHIGMATRPAGAEIFQPLLVDPVWWRNAVGGSLLVVAKDIGALLRAYLERRRLASRRVEAVPVARTLDVELVER